MPKEKPFKLGLHQFYKLSAEEYLLFGYVKAIQKIAPTVNIQTAIRLFREDFDVKDDDLCTESIWTMVFRTRNAYIDLKFKSNIDEKKK